MTPSTIIQLATAEGLKLALSPTGTIKVRGNEETVIRWVPIIREQKSGIVAALSGHLQKAVPTATTIAPERHDNTAVGVGPTVTLQRLLAMLDGDSSLRYAMVVQNPDTDPVSVTLGIRRAVPGSIVTCDLCIPKAKFDLALLTDLIQRYSGTVH